MTTNASDAGKAAKQRIENGLSGPDEFKDSPIRFEMELDGRREKIKIVEPEVDVALPHEGRLLIHEGNRCLHDLTFWFHIDADSPYQLRFSVKEGEDRTGTQPEGFGAPGDEDRQLRSTYRRDLLDRGGLKAWIEMTGGKARLFVQYKKKANGAK